MDSDRVFKRADVVTALLLMLAGGGVGLAAMQQSSGTPSDPLGPRGFPVFIGIALVCTGAVLLLQQVRASRRLRPQQRSSADVIQDDDDGPVSLRRLFTILMVMIAYVLVLPWAGFLLSTPVVLAGIMGLQGGVPRRTLILMVIGFPLAIYGLFTLLLGVPLPSGSLFALELVGKVGV